VKQRSFSKAADLKTMETVVSALESRAAEAESRMAALEARLASGKPLAALLRRALRGCASRSRRQASRDAQSLLAQGVLSREIAALTLKSSHIPQAHPSAVHPQEQARLPQTCASCVSCWWQPRRSRKRCAQSGIRWVAGWAFVRGCT